jgi:hypothetical protein
MYEDDGRMRLEEAARIWLIGKLEDPERMI